MVLGLSVKKNNAETSQQRESRKRGHTMIATGSPVRNEQAALYGAQQARKKVRLGRLSSTRKIAEKMKPKPLKMNTAKKEALVIWQNERPRPKKVRIPKMRENTIHRKKQKRRDFSNSTPKISGGERDGQKRESSSSWSCMK